jgi:hypothetical protein
MYGPLTFIDVCRCRGRSLLSSVTRQGVDNGITIIRLEASMQANVLALGTYGLVKHRCSGTARDP